MRTWFGSAPQLPHIYVDRIMISVLILTLNEQQNIEECLASLPWRDDVHVLDSGSTDNTLKLARSLGSKVSERRFDNFAAQRNTGLNLPFENEWIVMLDADERMTVELAKEIEQAILEADSHEAMFRVRRKDMLMGRWLRRASGYPTWFPRVFRRGRVHVEREINEIYVAEGRTRQLNGHLIHLPFNKGMDWWFERHNMYSTKEAALLVIGDMQMWPEISLRTLIDPGFRRAISKSIVYKLPFRPFLIFFYLFVIRGGFLDGYAGYLFASMRLAYEIMIDAKLSCTRSGSSE
jgi:glycosyltransferase involved in cell wall biosynthesis